jgi:hypothetical protein
MVVDDSKVVMNVGWYVGNDCVGDGCDGGGGGCGGGIGIAVEVMLVGIGG